MLSPSLMSILASHNNKRSSTEIHGGSRGPGPLSTDDADNPPSVVFTGLNNIHEDYVDWDHMKRQAMLTSLLTSHKKLIDESRVRLEEAAIEKKRKSEDLARLLRYAVEKLQESKQSLESVRIEEKEYRDRVESHMETLHSLKEQMIRKGNEHNMNKTETEIGGWIYNMKGEGGGGGPYKTVPSRVFFRFHHGFCCVVERHGDHQRRCVRAFVPGRIRKSEASVEKTTNLGRARERAAGSIGESARGRQRIRTDGMRTAFGGIILGPSLA